SEMMRQTQAYGAPGDATDAAAQAELKSILARREFSSVSNKGGSSLLRRKINELLVRLFRWLFGQIERFPIATQGLFWFVIAVVVGWLAMMLFRYWSNRARIDTIEKITTVVPHRPWQEWIRAAREAAARGDFREAIHCTYWAGVVRLEMAGALAPNP